MYFFHVFIETEIIILAQLHYVFLSLHMMIWIFIMCKNTSLLKGLFISFCIQDRLRFLCIRYCIYVLYNIQKLAKTYAQKRKNSKINLSFKFNTYLTHTYQWIIEIINRHFYKINRYSKIFYKIFYNSIWA